jgi:hypothetical protein
MEQVDAESPTAVPNAILDTNVLLAIYSWHDLTAVVDSVLDRDPTATLEHADIQFRAQRARAAFILTLFFDERGWMTQSPLNEVGRTLTGKVPPTDIARATEINYLKLYLYFIKDSLLPSWLPGADPEADGTKKGNDVDLLCLDWAERHKVPLISWEGSGPSGPIPSRLIPSEAARRGIDLVTPEELVHREGFNERAAARRFFAAWNKHAPVYLSTSPLFRDLVEHAHHFYMRMAKNDWTP